MRKLKRARLEATGWKLGDASEFLGLTEAESTAIERLLRRGLPKRIGRLADRDLTAAADAVFQELDRAENDRT